MTVDVTGDTAAEIDETFNLVLSVPAGAVISDAAGTATIVNDDAAALLAVSDIRVTEGNGGATAATFTVARTGNTSGTASAKYTVSGGTAASGTDYTAVTPGTLLSFVDGEASKTVTVEVTGDTLPEKHETFNLVLSAPTGAVLADAAGTATVLNDDGSAYLSVNNVQVNEGNAGTTPVTFTVTRSGNTDGASTVNYATSGGTATAGADYTGVSGSLSFVAGETSKEVTVNVNGDTAAELPETFNLVLTTPVGTAISDGSGAAKILNDD